MRKRSLKRQREINEFIPLAEAFLEANPWCQHPTNHPGQRVPATCIHHARGRRGRRLLNPEWWRSACAGCNDEAETNTGRSLAVGWLVRIEGV